MTLLNARQVLRDVEYERRRVSLTSLLRRAQMTWRVQLGAPDWATPRLPRVHGEITMDRTSYRGSQRVLGPLEFELPAVADCGPHPWRRWIDTFLDSPHDMSMGRGAPGCRLHPIAPSRNRGYPVRRPRIGTLVSVSDVLPSDCAPARRGNLTTRRGRHEQGVGHRLRRDAGHQAHGETAVPSPSLRSMANL